MPANAGIQSRALFHRKAHSLDPGLSRGDESFFRQTGEAVRRYFLAGAGLALLPAVPPAAPVSSVKRFLISSYF